jgi:hypothetical protein
MTLVALGQLDLGNNFSFGHFIDVLTETQIERIQKRFDIESDFRLVGMGNYGKIEVYTCGSDLLDWLR